MIPKLEQLYNIAQRASQHFTDSFSNLRNLAKEAFISFSIRRKLIIILLSVVIFVIAIMSFIFQHNEERILKSKLEEICNLSVRYLSLDIKEKLLLKRYEEVTESVLTIKQQQIQGLDYALVINREGQIIAHTDSTISMTDAQFIAPYFLNELNQLGDIGSYETDTHYEFYYPISFDIVENGVNVKKNAGYAGIGFLKDVILAPVREAQRIIFTIALIVTVISVLGIYFISQKMVKQIQELSAGAKKIGEGDLDVVIAVNSRDELGQLAREFNNMVMHLKEKLHMQKFVSQMTRQMIKRNIISNTKNFAGETREVAVIFSDVRNFSEFSQRHEPKFVINLVNIYLDLQAQIIERHFGVVDKFMGDQVMGIFEGRDKIRNVVNAGVEIQKQIRLLNAKRELLGEEILALGIGFNVGPTVVGNIGSKDRLDYTVVGDVVNLASRFCDVAKPGQIITSVELLEKCNRIYPTVKIGSIRVKGRSELIDICEIDYMRDIIM